MTDETNTHEGNTHEGNTHEGNTHEGNTHEINDDTPRSRRIFWAAPAAGVLAVAAAVTVPMVANADPSLPTKTAAQLLADVSAAHDTPMSGTVVETARLGFPSLPDTGATSISPTVLLAGSHTARVWYDGDNKARVALVGNLAETDLVRNGRDVWVWTSGQNTAQHLRLPAEESTGKPPATPEAVTPSAAAEQALRAIDPTTKVRVDGTARVAGRSAYELVLTPRDAASLVGDVRIAVDSETDVPLRVQVHARGATGRPAFETTFTSVTFATPSADVFTFTPPPGAKVSQLGSGDAETPREAPGGTAGRTAPRVIGKGWTAILEVPGVTPTADAKGQGSAGAQLGALMNAMTPVQGAYGSGRLLRTKLVSVLLLDDGRMFVGAVAPAALERAAAQ